MDVEWEWTGTNCAITNFYTHCCFSRVFSFRGCVFSFPQENKKDGLRLFTEDMVEVKSLPRQSVLDHFIACAPTLVIHYLVSGRGGGGGGGEREEGGGGGGGETA